jgi:PAS domain-containing protein
MLAATQPAACLQITLRPSAKLPSPREELEQAFSLFNEASAQLASAYQELQDQVARLTTELAVANGELRTQYEEKEALSRRLGLLLDALPGGVAVLDAGGRVLECNPVALALLGAAPGCYRRAAGVAAARCAGHPAATLGQHRSEPP